MDRLKCADGVVPPPPKSDALSSMTGVPFVKGDRGRREHGLTDLDILT
jgi:hypothetical protein